MRAYAWIATTTMAACLSKPGLAGADGPYLAARLDPGAMTPIVQLAAASGSVTCHVDANASIPSLYVRNSGAAPLPAGARIMWGAQPGGLSGVALVGPNGLPPGEWQYVGGYVGIRDCTASVIN